MKKPRGPQGSFTHYENFVYLLTELELIVRSGKIEWPVASAIAARRRLDKLTTAVHQLTSQFANEQSSRRCTDTPATSFQTTETGPEK